jgi:hypothetical protein
MIRKIALVLVASLVLFVSPVLAADDGQRHSGRVMEVKDGGATLVLEEMGPWLGRNTGLETRSIKLTPGATVRLVRPTGTWTSDASPGYEVQTIDVKDLKAGDFVTVSAGGVDVVRAEGSEGGLASPK